MSVISGTGDQDFSDVVGRSSDLRELQAQVTRLASTFMLALAIGLLFFAALALNHVGFDTVEIIAGLTLTPLVARWLLPIAPRAAGLTLVAGAVAILSRAIWFWPEWSLAPWFALVVPLAATVLNVRAGALVALAVTAILTNMFGPGWLVWPPNELGSAIFLSWASLFVYWLTSQPSRTTTAWAWSSYHRALEQTNQARERQGELAKLSKSLEESNYRFEQLNLELEQARRSAEEARRLKGQFATTVSHELRTPLNLILGFCEMMVLAPSTAYGERLPSSYEGDLQAIYRNVCHLSSLVDDILDLSQIDADRMALQPTWVSVGKVVDEAVASVAKLFYDREDRLRLEVAADLPLMYLDQTRIRQILINLLTNAARFTERGEITIRVCAAEARLILSVSDTGLGIPADELAGVFDAFYQVPVGGRRGGSGLGLTVSKRFAEMHGGAMWVESTLGIGSTFYLGLPIRPDDASVVGTGFDWGDRIGHRARGQAKCRVLVVDDSDTIVKVFQRYLDGYDVVRAADLCQVRRVTHGEPIQAIIVGSTDVGSIRDALLRVAPELARLPIITCPFRTTKHTAVDLGVDEYLVKPVRREQLRSAIRRLDRRVRQVLVVDDDVEMTHLLSRMVRSLVRGADVVVANDGRSAIAAALERRPDLILLDLLMPEMNGHAVVDAIRASDELRDTPIVMITAHGAGDEIMTADTLSITRAEGLTVSETVRWVRSGLDAALHRHKPDVASPTEPVGSPA